MWSCYPSITSILYDGSQDHLKSFFEKRKTDPNLIPMVYEIMTIQNTKVRTAKRILEILGIQTSSSFVKI